MHWLNFTTFTPTRHSRNQTSSAWSLENPFRKVKDFLIKGLTLSLVIAAPPATASPSADATVLAERARQIVSNGSYQKKLVPPLKMGIQGGNVHTRTPRGGGGGSLPLAQLILYLVIALALGLALVWLIGFIHRRFQQSAATKSTESEESPAEQKALSLNRIEQLAAAGHFDEAIHQLLLLAVESLSKARNYSLVESLTGRELARILPDSDDQRSGFKQLVVSVELSLFGGRSTDSATYSSCLLAYQRLLR